MLADFSAIIAAWQRSLPGLSCPLRLENGRVLFRHNPAFTGQAPEWSEGFVSRAGHIWWSFVEEEATDEANRYPDESAVSAVAYLSVDRWKPVVGTEKTCQ